MPSTADDQVGHAHKRSQMMLEDVADKRSTLGIEQRIWATRQREQSGRCAVLQRTEFISCVSQQARKGAAWSQLCRAGGRKAAFVQRWGSHGNAKGAAKWWPNGGYEIRNSFCSAPVSEPRGAFARSKADPTAET